MNLFEWSEEESRPHLDSVRTWGIELHPGDRVRLRPRHSADIMDMALAGKAAVIESIEQDLENQVHLAVVVDDDPGRDIGMMRHIGHRFFFSLDEIEPLPAENESEDYARGPV